MDERDLSTLPPYGAPRSWDPYAGYDRLGAARPRIVVPPRRSSSPLVNLVLFLLTLVTTTMAGAMHAGVDPFSDPWSMSAGLPFSVPLMTILLCHELGHYTAALRHGVPTTLPYFLPGPPFLVGTFGAFIRMRGMPRSRRALFDVGAAGPWAGLLVAIPTVVLGLLWSEVQPLTKGAGGGLALGNSLLFDGLSRAVLHTDPDSATILLHPVALAGWFGIFVTFLNLLPIGQLDGGHVVYALFGRRHRAIARLFLVVVLGLGFLGWEGWFLWALMLAFVLKVDHPPTMDAETPLDPARKIAAWATIGVFALTFMPVPITVVQPQVVIEHAPLPHGTQPPGRPGPPDRDEEPAEPGTVPLQHIRLAPRAPEGRAGLGALDSLRQASHAGGGRASRPITPGVRAA